MRKKKEVQTQLAPAKRTRKRKHEKEVNGVIYFTSCKAAQILGISRGTVLSWTRSKMLRGFRHGGQMLYAQQWINDFIDERTQEVK